MEIISSFFVSVVAGIVSGLIVWGIGKWFDGHNKKK